MQLRAITGALSAATLCAAAVASELPLVDAHIHYSHDAWEMLPPEDAVAALRAAGLRKAFVSSSSDEGTRRLHAVAPDLVVPVLRPYRRRGETLSWLRDGTVIEYLQGRLARLRYAGIGEFHVSGEDADLPVMRRVVELAREHGLFLHAHSDADAVERIFAQHPDAVVLWAHAGFAMRPGASGRCSSATTRSGPISPFAQSMRPVARWTLTGARSSRPSPSAS